MAGQTLEEVIASFMLGRRSSLPYKEWPEALAAAIREHFAVAEAAGVTSPATTTDDTLASKIRVVIAEARSGDIYDSTALLRIVALLPDPSPIDSAPTVAVLGNANGGNWPEVTT